MYIPVLVSNLLQRSWVVVVEVVVVAVVVVAVFVVVAVVVVVVAAAVLAAAVVEAEDVADETESSVKINITQNHADLQECVHYKMRYQRSRL